MNSPFLTLGKSDVVKGAITAVLAAVITVLYGVVSQSGFDVFSTDWGVILNQVIQASFTAFLAYMSKNLLSDSEGDFLGLSDSEQ